MTPYYSHGGITIYHGDCLEVLPGLGPVDLVLTDPPYGMNHEPTRRGSGSKHWGAERIRGDKQKFSPDHLLDTAPNLILWGANWYASALPDSGGWLVWDKRAKWENPDFTASSAELAWTNNGGLIRTFRMQWGGPARGGEGLFHPTQKPVALMGWCLSFCSQAKIVLDPYCGSGPTLRAAMDRGLSAIGIEIEERYCEIAARRLEQEVLDLNGGTA